MGPFPRRSFTFSLILAALFSTASALAAQDVQAPAHVGVVDGSATLERESSTEAVTIGEPLIPGDRLRTTGGRVEVLFADGSALDVDEYATLDIQADTLVRLVGGRVLLTVAGAADPSGASRYQVDTPVASARNDGPGEYRIAVMNGPAGLEGELAVLRGAAYLTTENGSTLVRAGERSLARDNAAPGAPQMFNSARFDAFDQWASARREDRLGTASAQYLPRDLQSYGGTLDRNGLWQYEPSYGNVWYPSVAPGWRPYYNGYWAPVRPYGWTWIGLDVWGWPTHHYGRWGFARDRWFWIPGPRYSAAWVSWAAAPGYVGWCPLGFDNRPVFALTISTGNPWAGWVLLPRSHFGAPGRIVRQYAVASPSFSVHVPLVVQSSAPVPIIGHAVARQSIAQRDNSIAIQRGAVAAAPSQEHSGAIGRAAPRINSAQAVVGPNQDVRGRAVPRQIAPAAAASSPVRAAPTDAPIFKLPLPGSRQRSGAPVPATASPQTPVNSPPPGARPYQGRNRSLPPAGTQQPADPRAQRDMPAPVPQFRRFEARPRPDAGGAPQYSPTVPSQQPSYGSRRSVAPSASDGPRAMPSPPAGRPAPTEPPAGARASSRSAPAQAAPAQNDRSSSPPAGARAAHRR